MVSAAEWVNVRHKIDSGRLSAILRIFAMRRERSWVFPDPGHAITITGP